MNIFRSITDPLRDDLSWKECWGNESSAALSSWERGREKRLEDAELAAKAVKNELPMLPWKGGFPPPKTSKKGKLKKSPKQTIKYGSFNYLAMWQGLRCEDLNIDLENEINFTCSFTGKTTTFTNSLAKLLQELKSEGD